jgi:hypothetical protein
MSGIEIQAKGLIATPVAATILPDAEARNAELREIILRHRAEHPSIGASRTDDQAKISSKKFCMAVHERRSACLL